MSAYWSLYILAWGLSALVFGVRAGKARVPALAIADVFLFALPLAIVCTHLAFALAAPGNLSNWRHFFFSAEGWRSGHTSFGAVGGVVIAIWIASVIHRLPFLRLADCAAPVVFVASVAMRTGCFLAGCCYGGPTAAPWGTQFPSSNPLQPLTAPSHPSQLYEVALSLVILAFLPYLSRTLKFRSSAGAETVFCLLLYFSERFILEFFRIGGTSEAVYLGLSATQYGTFAGAVSCACLFAALRHRPQASDGASVASPLTQL